MTVSHFDLAVFNTDTNWEKELSESESRIEEVCQEIIRTLGGYQKIKWFRASVVGGDIEDCFFAEDVTLLKRSTMLHFRKRNDSEDHELAKTYIEDINGILFRKVSEDESGTYYTILLSEKWQLPWKYDIVI